MGGKNAGTEEGVRLNILLDNAVLDIETRGLRECDHEASGNITFDDLNRGALQRWMSFQLRYTVRHLLLI